MDIFSFVIVVFTLLALLCSPCILKKVHLSSRQHTDLQRAMSVDCLTPHGCHYVNSKNRAQGIIHKRRLQKMQNISTETMAKSPFIKT